MSLQCVNFLRLSLLTQRRINDFSPSDSTIVTDNNLLRKIAHNFIQVNYHPRSCHWFDIGKDESKTIPPFLHFSGKCKLDVSKYPRDKVILFQVRRGPFAPSMSPFALKLETYLRMAEIPYQVGTQNVDVLFCFFYFGHIDDSDITQCGSYRLIHWLCFITSINNRPEMIA